MGWLAPLGLILGLAWLGWMALGDARIQFLTPGTSPWIVYPSPFNGETIRAAELPADFRRSFTLTQTPARAELEWRCFRVGTVTINGNLVAAAQGSWKRAKGSDVTPFLREGTNEIEIMVTADTGPPALNARLQADGVTVATDEDWDVSYAGALRMPARFASAEPENMPQNELPGNGRALAAFGRVWGFEILFLTAAATVVWRWRRKFEIKFVAGLFGVAWVVLLCHNLPLIRFCTGFDSSAHLQYIDYLLKNGRLPHANEGWEMFQPPLYYLISAAFLHVIGLGVFTAAGMAALHIVNALIGAANIALLFWGLRMVFPGEAKKQLAGTILGAFIPCQLYLLHYPTNEVLMGMMGTLSLCLCLKCLQRKPVWVGWKVALGLALGGACCAKASAFALFPAVFAALGMDLLARRERRASVWAQNILMVALSAVIIGGWHYWRLASEYGNPLAGLWTSGGRRPWWQQSGYLTAGYFLSFGRSLTSPYFAGIHSFWDSLYATFWGDSLWGGQLISGRELWNSDFMAVGFALALPLTLLTASGGFVLTARWMRAARAVGSAGAWPYQTHTLLLILAPGMYLFALAMITLKLPYYDQAKAFYALPALLPLCVFAVAGWEFWKSRGKAIGPILLILSGVFWLNNFASFWIRSDSVHFRLCRAMADYQTMHASAAKDFEDVLAVDSTNKTAEMYLALLSREAGRTDQFEAYLKKAMADHWFDAEISALAADSQARVKNWGVALPLAAQAAKEDLDNYAVALTWMRFARETQRDQDVVAAGEMVLRDRPGLIEAHQAMAEALNRLGRTGEAAFHAKIASEGR